MLWPHQSSNDNKMYCRNLAYDPKTKIGDFKPLVSLIGSLYHIDSGNQQFLDLVEALLFVCRLVVGATRPWV